MTVTKNKPVSETNIDLSDIPDNDETVVDEDTETVTSAEIDSDIVDEDMDVDPKDRLPARAVLNADGSVTLPLKYPQTIKTKKNGKVRARNFDVLVLHRLNGVDRRVIGSASDDLMSATALARMARMNQAVANRLDQLMDISDTNAVGQVLANFTSTGLKVGKDS